MWHPLFKTLATQPELWVAHAGAYADLAAAETTQLQQALGRQAVLASVTLIGAALAAGLAGVALLLASVLPTSSMPWPIGLWLVPSAPLALALVTGLAWQRTRRTPAFSALREQLSADAALFAEAGRA